MSESGRPPGTIGGKKQKREVLWMQRVKGTYPCLNTPYAAELLVSRLLPLCYQTEQASPGISIIRTRWTTITCLRYNSRKNSLCICVPFLQQPVV